MTIKLKPLSINDAHKGRHFKTQEFHRYERDFCKLIPFCRGHAHTLDTGKEYLIKYVFYLKNYSRSDTGNFEKLITDLLVKRGYLKDDRYVKAFYLEKQPVKDTKDEKIVLDIVLYDKRHDVL